MFVKLIGTSSFPSLIWRKILRLPKQKQKQNPQNNNNNNNKKTQNMNMNDVFLQRKG